MCTLNETIIDNCNNIYTDIKAENVLLSRKDPDVDVSDLNNLVFKIADFGCTRVLEDKLLKTFQGTIIYMVTAAVT